MTSRSLENARVHQALASLSQKQGEIGKGVGWYIGLVRFFIRDNL